MKICAKCKLDRPLDDFHNDRRHADGKNIWCKPCKDEWTRSQGKLFDPNEDLQQNKTCYTCKRVLAIADFHRDKRRRDGRAPNCKQCVHSTFQRSGLCRPPDHEKRLCPKCKTERTVSDFARDRNRTDGIAIHCKPCRRAYSAANAATMQKKMREWNEQQGNRDKMVEWHRLNFERRFFYYRAGNHCGSGENRLHQRELALELARLWKRQRGICAVTGWRLDKDNSQLDHIVPKTLGGTTAIENLRWVHRDVNYAKRDLTDEAFLRLCNAVVANSTLQPLGINPSLEKDINAKRTPHAPGTTNQLARLSNQPMKNAVNSADPYRRKPMATLSQAAARRKVQRLFPPGK